MIPEPAAADGTRPPPKIQSALDRRSLLQIAVAGGGEYFEIGAIRLHHCLPHRRSAAQLGLNGKPVKTFEDLYAKFLLAAAILLGVGMLVVRKRTDLAWQTDDALAVLLLPASVM